MDPSKNLKYDYTYKPHGYNTTAAGPDQSPIDSPLSDVPIRKSGLHRGRARDSKYEEQF